MSKYENAMKLLEGRCGNDKEVVIGLATIALSPNAAGNPVQQSVWFALIMKTAYFMFLRTQEKIKCCKLRRTTRFPFVG